MRGGRTEPKGPWPAVRIGRRQAVADLANEYRRADRPPDRPRLTAKEANPRDYGEHRALRGELGALSIVGAGPRAGRSPAGGQLVGKSSAVLIRLLIRAPDSVSTPLLL
ncbi:hypothetical protein GCM10010266_58180 [Streptomyces griseomycini]|nr:hypothetical protein GCM10010266_58180 [Streptomyces griseomycini]GGR46346.1 hypothetical protein GCM10015536_60190 [Streptomyces griseomycini]